MSNQELITKALTNMSNEEKSLIFPPITRKNFVVRKSWLGRNQVITFINNKNQQRHEDKTGKSIQNTVQLQEINQTLNVSSRQLSLAPAFKKNNMHNLSIFEL